MALARKLPLISDRPLAKAGLNSERVLMPNKGPGVFEEEIDGIEDALGITTVEKAVAWAQANSMWPDTFGLACCAIEMMSIVSSRYDISRFGMERFSSSPRQADLLIVSGRVTPQDGGAAAPGLRPDARAEMGDRDGRLRQLGRDVQQLHRRSRASTRSCRSTSTCPGAHRGRRR